MSVAALATAPTAFCRECGNTPAAAPGATCYRCSELARVIVSRRRWRRAFWALVMIWAGLVVVALIAGAPPASCPQAASQAPAAHSMAPDVRGASRTVPA